MEKSIHSSLEINDLKGFIIPTDSVIEEVRESKPPKKRPVKKLFNNIKTFDIKKVKRSAFTFCDTTIETVISKDTFPFRFTSIPKGKHTKAKIPSITEAKDMAHQSPNPKNFSYYTDFEGLNGRQVTDLIQDKFGNIWIGSSQSGVVKYNGKHFVNYTQKEGLGSNKIRCMLEDSEGNIWFGYNYDGVTCYDGISFINYKSKEGFIDGSVFDIIEDRKGDIWFATSNGLIKYHKAKQDTIKSNKLKAEKKRQKLYTSDAKEELFVTYKNSDVSSSAEDYIWSLSEDEQGNIWIQTDASIFVYDGISFKKKLDIKGVVSKSRSKASWFKSAKGLSRFDGKSMMVFNSEIGQLPDYFECILEDSKGNIWFASERGVHLFDGESIVNYTKNDGLPDNVVNDILEDRSGNIWLATNLGLCLYNGQTILNYSKNEGLSDNLIKSIIQDRHGNYWFGTLEGGVTVFNGEVYKYLTKKDGLVDDCIISILEDRTGNIWFGSFGGGLSKYDGESIVNYTKEQGFSGIHRMIEAIKQDSKGDIWLATMGGVIRYNGKEFKEIYDKQGLFYCANYCFYEDHAGNMWRGTYLGAYCYDGKNHIRFSKKEGLPFERVNVITQDVYGNVWFGCEDGGIVVYNGLKYIVLTERQGLVGSKVRSLVRDSLGQMWIGTNKGVSRMTKTKMLELNNSLNGGGSFNSESAFINYGYNDGFIGWSCRKGSTLIDTSNNIWWGANSLMKYISKNDLLDTTPPVMTIDGLSLYGVRFDWTNTGAYDIDSTGIIEISGKIKDTILSNGVVLSDIRFEGVSRFNTLPMALSLPHNNNNLSFHFTGVHMQSRNHIKYKYIMDGLDLNWSTASDKNEAHYANLPVGEYTFKVKAMNQSGIWSLPLHFTFEVRPPWYRTWWAYSVYVLAVLGAFYLFMQARTKQLVKEKEKLEQTVTERTTEIVLQKSLIEEKHKEITDSINYAERIQRSFLATKELLDKNLQEYFVFFQPKEAVSGDFYWAGHLSNGSFALLTADSTGHGVPGAIMSILNITCVENAIKDKLTEPKEILNHTRANIIERLKNDGSKEGGKDGMDCSLICFDKEKSKILFSGANNPVWIARVSTGSAGLELIELEPDKMPVGKHDKDSQSFTQYEISLQKGDVIYTLTDGYPDQFGGPKGKKFMYKKLKELLLEIGSQTMREQEVGLKRTLEEWQGTAEQVDDITIIGVRV